MAEKWLTIKTFGQPLRLYNLYVGLASYNAGCFIQSLRKTRRGYSIVICVSPEFDMPDITHDEALARLKSELKLYREIE